jgi:hypothetical protein
MAVYKNNLISYTEVISYLLPANETSNYLNNYINNSGKSTTVAAQYHPRAVVGNPNGGHPSNNFSNEWIMPTKDASGAEVYTDISKVNIAQLIQNYLFNNGYNINEKKYSKITVEDLVRIQSMIITYIKANVHKFKGTLNPGGAVAVMNRSLDTKNKTGNAQTFSTPTLYTPIQSNPTVTQTFDPNNLMSKKYEPVTAKDLQDVRNVISSHLSNVATLVLVNTSYCHSNCYCHNSCCSCSCGHGRWL